MIALHLVRAPVSVRDLARWAGQRDVAWASRNGRGGAFDEGRALHHLLNEMLGPGALRPFRLLVPPRRTVGNLYAYSARDAETLRADAGAWAPPEHLSVLSPDGLESKLMPARWRAGQMLGFDLRARPVRRLSRNLDKFRAGREVDAFVLEALRNHPKERLGMASDRRTREAVYLDWLAHRIAPAAELNRAQSRLVRFRRVRAARKDTGSEGPDATIQGTLTVTDPTAFSGLLKRGVGRHRAYGYGMLLLRPPNRPAPER